MTGQGGHLVFHRFMHAEFTELRRTEITNDATNDGLTLLTLGAYHSCLFFKSMENFIFPSV